MVTIVGCGRRIARRRSRVLVLARNPNPLPRCRRAHRHVRRPASSIFPIHDIGELARRLMLRSLPAAVMGRSAGRVDETLDVARTALLHRSPRLGGASSIAWRALSLTLMLRPFLFDLVDERHQHEKDDQHRCNDAYTEQIVIHLVPYPIHAGQQPGKDRNDEDDELQRSRRIITGLRQTKDEKDLEGV